MPVWAIFEDPNGDRMSDIALLKADTEPSILQLEEHQTVGHIGDG
jgi:hypothetical protein